MATASEAWAVKSLNSEWCIPAKKKKRNTEEFSETEEDSNKPRQKKVRRFVVSAVPAYFVVESIRFSVLLDWRFLNDVNCY